ncbi:hypothetical protein [Mesorhizobium carmichaelinearum]|uniref:hypothetical protein n=1 Tax=Mesorhizobium carmichaelinearum TaxID=1208188 RepID=UPI000BA4DCCA|nr:hypothetical protein [Mesorhizobium carmichaelinearum]
MDVFVSVGTGLSPKQEAFVEALEARLRAVGLTPCTIGRNTFSADAPLRAVTELMDRCAGAVVVALERFRFTEGIERPGSAQEKTLSAVSFPTTWNQIEAAMAYSRGLPLLVLVEDRLRVDGLLEKGNDWYVQYLSVEPVSFGSPEFTGVLESWRGRLKVTKQNVSAPAVVEQVKLDPSNMTVAEIVGALKPAQLWTALGVVAAALVGAFTLGAKLFG